jgi:hypothetical protein
MSWREALKRQSKALAELADQVPGASHTIFAAIKSRSANELELFAAA